MGYIFSVNQVCDRDEDDSEIGLVITVLCEKTNGAGSEVVGHSELTWFAEKSEFGSWPPSHEEIKTYMVAYLNANPPGSQTSRAENMRQSAVVLRDSPQAWTEEEKELPI